MNAFVSTPVHLVAMGRFEEWRAPAATFTDWDATDVKLDWTEALERLRASAPVPPPTTS